MIFKKKDEKLKKELLLQLQKLHYTLTGNSDIVLTEKSKLNHTIDLTSQIRMVFLVYNYTVLYKNHPTLLTILV